MGVQPAATAAANVVDGVAGERGSARLGAEVGQGEVESVGVGFLAARLAVHAHHDRDQVGPAEAVERPLGVRVGSARDETEAVVAGQGF